MKFAINENTIFQCHLSEFLDVCGSAGFKAVEVSYAKLKDELKFVSPSSLKGQLKKYNMKVLSINAFEDTFLVPREGLKVLEREAHLLAELCLAIGSPAIVAPSGRWYDIYGPLPSREEINKLYRERLALLKELFGSYDLEFMFEPIEFPEFVVGDTAWMNEILDSPSLRNIPIVPDIHNLLPNGEGPQQLGKFNNPIGIFHIDDTLDLEGETVDVAKSRCFPGDGVSHAVEWIKEAEKAGYKGYYSLELFDDALWEMSPSGASQLCRQKLEIFEKMLQMQ